MSDDEWKAFLAAIPEEKFPSVSQEEREEYLRKEGVRDGDVAWWNGMSHDEQEGLKRVLQTQNLELLMHFHNDQGIPAQEAFVKMHKTNAIYDDYPLSDRHVVELNKNSFQEEDYPLPWQLSDRIGRFMGSLVIGSEIQLHVQTLLQRSTSANAAIRLMIRNGIL